MVERELVEQRFRSAFRLAWFIHREKQTALRVAREAVAKLDVAVGAQDKRRYYVPGRRLFSRGWRTKVSLDELHLLQRLVYIESEPYEIQRERSDGVSEEDMLVHFLKHVVRITIKRNSFYVNLGISRLVHNFTTAEAMDIYNLVVQDPDRVRDDPYYRSRKARLIDEINVRFSDFLRVVRGPRAEERFETTPRTERLTRLVHRCCEIFTPWKTLCPVPAAINPVADTLPALCFQGSHPDEEHGIEVNRFHALLHPDCYCRIVRALKLGSPAERLEIPRFYLSRMNENGSGDGDDRHHPPALTPEDISAMRNNLAEQEVRRKSWAGGLLRILVDGMEQARFDPRVDRSVLLELNDGAEWIETRTIDDDILLACHLLTINEGASSTGCSEYSIALQGGQHLTLRIARLANGSGVSVEVRTGETVIPRGRWLWPERYSGVRPGWALTALAVAVILAGLPFYYWFPNRDRKPVIVEQSTPGSGTGERPVPDQRQMARSQPPRAGEEALTRQLPGQAVVTALRHVKKIYVDPLGADPTSENLRTLLMQAVVSGGRFVVPDSRDESDAVFKGTVTLVPHTSAKPERMVEVRLQLINAAGETLWPPKGTVYRGTPGQVSDQIAGELNSAVR